MKAETIAYYILTAFLAAMILALVLGKVKVHATATSTGSTTYQQQSQ